MDLVDEIRTACADVARRARFVAVDEERIPSYARTLPRATPAGDDLIAGASLEERAAFVCALDAINFGSGWFPTLRKRPGRSGYFTVALGLRHRFTNGGPWSAAELAQVEASQVAAWLGGTAAGVLGGDFVGNPERFGLDAIFPAFFLVLLVSELRGGRSAVTVALIAAALALLLVPVVPPGVPVIAACAAALLGLRRTS